jgi:DNA-binding MarR family transcriptional regulator
MNDRRSEIGDLLLRVLNKFLANQRQPRHYGLEELLYPAEVHLIMLIGKHPQAGVTELAAVAGVTKGAVSQMAQRLEQKGLTIRIPDPEIATKVQFELTNKGRIAFYSHERLHEEADQELLEFVDRLKPGQLKTLKSFLSLVERGIDKKSET